jgi:cobalt-zinc-cadmium efflux system outer membrane protein
MDSPKSLGGRDVGPLTGLLTLVLVLPACQTVRPDPAAERAVEQALLLGELVNYRVEGGPLDEPLGDRGAALTIGEATHRAVVTDPELQAALARVRTAMAGADQARLLPNPVLNLVTRWGPGTPQIEVGLTEAFIRMLQIPRQSCAADNRMRESAAGAVTVALDVVAEVQERYTAAQASDRNVPALEGRLDLLRQLASVAQSRLDAGEGVRNDVTTLDAQRVELEIEIAEARLRRREERLRLARLIGEPSSTATWTLDTWSPPAPISMTEQAWIDVALLRRPEVQSIAWRLAALGDDYALTRLLPWDGASAGVDIQSGSGLFAGPSISTPIPLFDKGQARKAEVCAEQVEARHALTLSKRKVVEEVRVAYQALTGNLANLDRIRRELIPLQQQRRDQTEQTYRAGQTEVTPLFLAEQDLRASQAKAIDVERQTALALIRLQRAVGGAGAAANIRRPITQAPGAAAPKINTMPDVDNRSKGGN